MRLLTEIGKLMREITPEFGCESVKIHGVRAIMAIIDMLHITAKQCPFLGAENDKVVVGKTE